MYSQLGTIRGSIAETVAQMTKLRACSYGRQTADGAAVPSRRAGSKRSYEDG